MTTSKIHLNQAGRKKYFEKLQKIIDCGKWISSCSEVATRIPCWPSGATSQCGQKVTTGQLGLTASTPS
eukprot:scaffold386163_cov18-Prasinocladus_malaysianus.AAC.1